MNKIFFLILIIVLLNSTQLFASKQIYFSVSNTNDTCTLAHTLTLFDNSDDNKFEFLFYVSCPGKSRVYSLIDRTNNMPLDGESAILSSGDLLNKDFFVYLLIPENSNYTHKIYYDKTSNSAVIEDINSNNGDSPFVDIADNYFNTITNGGFVRIIKKTDFIISLIKLCNLQGMVLDNKTIYNNQTEYSFDLSSQPAGMYFIWVVTDKNVFVKRIIYTP